MTPCSASDMKKNGRGTSTAIWKHSYTVLEKKRKFHDILKVMQYWSLVHDADLFVDLSNLFSEGQWKKGYRGEILFNKMCKEPHIQLFTTNTVVCILVRMKSFLRF
jgi:hypothetical protein